MHVHALRTLARMRIELPAAVARSKVNLKEKSKCLCSVGFNTTMELAMG